MRDKLLTLNDAFLFLCVSMYLGTGWSLVLFSFPIADQLNTGNYYLQFVPQVTAATHFFTYMTVLMIAAGLIMAWARWKTPMRWVPVVVLLMVFAATGLTTQFILPLNDKMSAGITSETQLRSILSEWMNLNRIRVLLWTVQWLALMTYFGRCAYQAMAE